MFLCARYPCKKFFDVRGTPVTQVPNDVAEGPGQGPMFGPRIQGYLAHKKALIRKRMVFSYVRGTPAMQVPSEVAGRSEKGPMLGVVLCARYPRKFFSYVRGTHIGCVVMCKVSL